MADDRSAYNDRRTGGRQLGPVSFSEQPRPARTGSWVTRPPHRRSQRLTRAPGAA